MPRYRFHIDTADPRPEDDPERTKQGRVRLTKGSGDSADLAEFLIEVGQSLRSKTSPNLRGSLVRAVITRID